MQIPLLTILYLVAGLAPLLDALSWLLELPGAIAGAYGSSVRWAIDFAHDLFEDYGYWVVFFGTLTENTLLLGFIVPGAIIVTIAGIAAQDGDISLPIAYVLALLGTIIGDTISYCLGRFGWSRFGHWSMFKDVNTKVRGPLLERGTLFVMTYHFAGYTRVVGPTASGFLKMPFRKWVVADYIGAALWVFVYMGVGYILGSLGLTLDTSEDYFRYVEWALIVLFCIAAYSIYRSAEKAWAAKKASEDEEPGTPSVQKSIL